MIYPKNFEQKIGFDIIREKLKANCLSSRGQYFVDKIKFAKDFDIVRRLIDQVEEFRQILLFAESFPSQDYLDLSSELNRIQIPGTIIEIEALFDLKSSIKTILEILLFFKKSEDGDYPNLKVLAQDIYIDNLISKKIDSIVDKKGEILDSASPELKEIRQKQRRKHALIDRKISQNLKNAKHEGWTNNDVEATLRNGRLVIPVAATHKRKLRGFIHDESATGQTVYIEPEDIFEVNNEIRELENAERREIIRILTSLTDYIRPNIETLKTAYRFLGLIDFIRAKAKFAIEIEAKKPLLVKSTKIEWIEARHPLLIISHKLQNKDVIPLNIALDKKKRILIISGPNAGGKSVCLKSVGLIQYMTQCGLLPSMDEKSEVGLFDNLFIDIGDEQSIENDLSTYSSHLMNIKHFALNSNQKTLLLIDEFGTGTEPQLGGAIAEAALEKLYANQAFAVVTTHYANLKLLADNYPEMINGAMLFDTKNMKPLYVLKVGQPGSSFAFEIARNIGFPKEILKNAASKTGRTQLDFDKQLQQLEIEKIALNKQKTELNVADDFLVELTDKYEALVEKLNSSKAEIINKAKKEAQSLLDSSNKAIEKTIKEIKEAKADQVKTKRIRKELESKKEAIAKDIGKSGDKLSGKAKRDTNKEIESGESSKLSVGDFVKVINQDTIGEVAEISGKDALISFNSIKFRTQISKLEKISRTQAKKELKPKQRSNFNLIANDINEKAANFSLSIDLRGKRVEEALTMIRDYIDEAILLNAKEVNILHGKGDGVLRQVVREYLDGITEVKKYHDQHVQFGGSGITIVNFK